MKAFSLSILFFLFSLSAVFTQDYRFDHLTANEDLSDDFIRRVFEDSYGYIWIATKNGLSRYDGYTIKTYQSKEDDSTTLPSSYIADIKEDTLGNLWIGTGDGLAKYDRQHDRFEQYLTQNTNTNSIYDMELDRSILWLGTQAGLCKFDIESKTEQWFFTKFTADTLKTSEYRILRVVKGVHDDIWVGYAVGNGLVKFNSTNNNYVQYTNDPQLPNSIGSNSVSAITPINDSLLLVGCIHSGVGVFNSHSETYRAIEQPVAKTTIGINMPWEMLFDTDKNLWIGSINGGLFLYDSLLRFSRNIIPYESNTDGLNSLSVSSIIEDQKGNIWLGTHGGGVNILFRRKNLFKHYNKTSNQESISHNLVSSFYSNNSTFNTIWVGTDGGGLNKLNLSTNSFNHFTTDDGLSSNAILSIGPYSKDTIVLASWDGGVILFNTNTYQSRSLQYNEHTTNSLNYKFLKHVFRQGDSLVVSAHARGINYYNIQSRQFYNSNTSTNHSYLAEPETGNKSLYHNGNLWVATTKGLYRINNGKTFEYLPNKNKTGSILDKYITDLFVDSENRLWISSIKVLNQYHPETDDFISFPKFKELNKAIVSIVQDTYENLWMGTNTGLIRFNFNDKSLSSFNTLDGLQGNQFFERSAYLNKNGKLFFGGMNGFNTFNPIDLQKDTTAPSVYFSDLKIFYESQKPGAEHSVLEKDIAFTDTIILNYSQNIITLEYTGIHFLSPQKNEYRYTLEGFDNKWYNVGTVRTATYTNLSPGTYTFKVKACNADKIWSALSKDLTIIVLPPWWMTWWFRTISVIAVILAIIILFYLRTRRITIRNRILKKEVAIRTAELQELNQELEANKEELQAKNDQLRETINTKDRFFSIIAHDLKNPMNVILGLSDLLISQWDSYVDDKKKNFVDKVHQSSEKLYNLLINLLHWSQTQTGKITINCKELTLSPIVVETVSLLHGQATAKAINLHISIQSEPTIFADENMLSTVLRNITSNAIKYTPKNGEIKIEGAQTNFGTEIKIIDNGVGMTNEQIQSLFKVEVNNSTAGTENELGTGLGLLVCHEFIMRMNGKLSIQSNIGKGTTFTITIPNQKQARINK